jgi:hypothetical protein
MVLVIGLMVECEAMGHPTGRRYPPNATILAPWDIHEGHTPRELRRSITLVDEPESCLPPAGSKILNEGKKPPTISVVAVVTPTDHQLIRARLRRGLN